MLFSYYFVWFLNKMGGSPRKKKQKKKTANFSRARARLEGKEEHAALGIKLQSPISPDSP